MCAYCAQDFFQNSILSFENGVDPNQLTTRWMQVNNEIARKEFKLNYTFYFWQQLWAKVKHSYNFVPGEPLVDSKHEIVI